MTRLHSLLLVGLALLGCEDPLQSVSSIQGPRLLGVRVSVAGDAKRGTPAPGESATAEFLLATKDGDPSVSFALEACTTTQSYSGIAECLATPFATALQASPIPGRAAFPFAVPADLGVNSGLRGLIRGVICANSELSGADSAAPHCADGQNGELSFDFEFGAAGSATANSNPELVSDALSLDGNPWLAATAGATETCPSSLLEVHAGSSHQLSVRLRDSDFEPLTQLSPEDPTRETLLVSHFSSAGTLGHAFSWLTAASPALTATMPWDAPKTVSGTQLIHFYFVARDSRGGQDFAERALCLVP